MEYAKKTPALSVVLPVYCAGAENYEYLKETLSSIAGQKYRDFEAIVVDDSSPDDIPPLRDEVQPLLPSLRVLRNKTNMCHIFSRNMVTKAADGTYIAYMDHDDIWLPDSLGRRLQALMGAPDCDMCFCDVDIFGSGAHKMKVNQSKIPEFVDFVWFAARFNMTITSSAVIVKKSAMERIGGFDQKYSICDDFDAWLRILENGGGCVHVPEKLVRYRLHDANTSLYSDRLKDHYLITKYITGYYFKAPFGTKLRLTYKVGRKWLGVAYLALRKLFVR